MAVTAPAARRRVEPRGPGLQTPSGLRDRDSHAGPADRRAGEPLPRALPLRLHRAGRGRQDDRHGLRAGGIVGGGGGYGGMFVRGWSARDVS